jgi:hypothetical protein
VTNSAAFNSVIFAYIKDQNDASATPSAVARAGTLLRLLGQTGGADISDSAADVNPALTIAANAERIMEQLVSTLRAW